MNERINMTSLRVRAVSAENCATRVPWDSWPAETTEISVGPFRGDPSRRENYKVPAWRAPRMEND